MTDDEARAVVGPRANYYLRHWAHPGTLRFNWAAFFFSGLWLAYRKMYRAAAVLFGIVALESVLEYLVFVMWLGWADTPRAVDLVVGLAVGCVCGRLGNLWYRRHVERIVATTKATGMVESSERSTLARRGGTSLLGALGAFGAFIIVAMAVLVVIELAWGQP